MHRPLRDRLRRPQIFYGWWIVGAALMAQTLQSLVFNLGASALFLPVAREFGTTRTVVSGVFAVSRLEGGLTGPIEGFLIHWVGARRYMMVGWVVFGAGLIAIGLSQNILHFYAAFLLTSLGQSMAGFLPIVTVLVSWFLKSRGRAIAIFQVGSSLGAVLIPALAWSILNVGWRETMVGAGILTTLIGVPLGAMMRDRPEDYGLLPDGAPNQESGQGAEEAGNGQADPIDAPMTVGQALQSRSFWFLGTAHATSLLTWGALRVHMIPALTDKGLDEQMAAIIFSLTLTVAAVGRLLGGFLADLIGTRRVLIVCILGQAASMAFLVQASSLLEAVAFAVIFGVVFGARATLLTVLRAEVFGRANFSRLAGLMDPISTVGVVVAPIFAGYAFDSRGSYDGAFLVMAAASTIAALLLFGVRIRQPARVPEHS